MVHGSGDTRSVRRRVVTDHIVRAWKRGIIYSL